MSAKEIAAFLGRNPLVAGFPRANSLSAPAEGEAV